MPVQRIAVIGGVASGTAAAAQAARTDPSAEVVLFEQGPHISYGACEIPYYISDAVDSAEKLVQFDAKRFLKEKRVVARTGHTVLAIHPARNRLTVKPPAGAQLEERFDKFILATGATADTLDIDGASAPNVFTIRTLEGAVDLKNWLAGHRINHAVIIGGGYIGVEISDSLMARGIRATTLDPSGVLHRYVSPALQPVVASHFTARGLQIRRERAVRFEHDAVGDVNAVLTDAGERIGCQLVIVAIGISPNSCLAKDAGLRVTPNGCVDVDEHMRSSAPNVWACGDCVMTKRVVDGAWIYLPLSPAAFRTGHVAGENAARQGRGAPARFPGVVGASAVRALGLEVAHVGLSLAEARDAGIDAFAEKVEGFSRVSVDPGSRRLYVELVVDRARGRLIGGTLVGEDGAALRANILVPLIWKGWTVDAVRDLDLIYNPPIAPAIDPLLTAANRAARNLGRASL